MGEDPAYHDEQSLFILWSESEQMSFIKVNIGTTKTTILIKKQ